VTRRQASLLIVTAILQTPAVGGEIPGLPSMLPPVIDSRFQLSLSNDFLGRGGSIDDFRTQQFVFSATIGERWMGVVDHSVLTLSNPDLPGRVDQLSASIGYRWLDRRRGNVFERIVVGGGLRGVGDFAGERMQNGFHRLVGSDTENLPYSDVDETAMTGWIDAERVALSGDGTDRWGFGYWLRGRALATSDGQFDATVMVAGVARRGRLDAWAGLRSDWRSGYDETVQRATADAEEDLAAVVGLRFGSLVLETVQQFDNDASFGRLQLLSLEGDAITGWSHERFGLELGFLLPDVHLRLAGRYRTTFLSAPAWRSAFTLSLDIGEPQLGGDPTLYVESRQLAVGMEWQRTLSTDSDWMDGYAGFGVGYRDERVVGDGAQSGVRSESVGRGVLVANAGVRLRASTLGSAWRYRIQTGISAWIPWGDASVSVGAGNVTIQEPVLGLSLGVSFDRQ
jgi:hypothetical protein